MYEAQAVNCRATLSELDIDSIDAVDVVVRFRDLTGRRVEPEVFRNVRTIGDVVEALHQISNAIGDYYQARGELPVVDLLSKGYAKLLGNG